MHVIFHVYDKPVTASVDDYRDSIANRGCLYLTLSDGEWKIDMHAMTPDAIRQLAADMTNAVDQYELAHNEDMPTAQERSDRIKDRLALDPNGRGCQHVEMGQPACAACSDPPAAEVKQFMDDMAADDARQLAAEE